MTMDEMKRIFDIEGITVKISSDHSIEEQHENGEDYFGLKSNDTRWNLVLYKKEKRNEEVIKAIFNTKEEALRYFCIFELRGKFVKEMINPAIRGNAVIYSESFDWEALQSLFLKYKIDKAYYNLETGIKGNAINLEKLGHETYAVKAFSSDGRCIYKTEAIDQQSALFVCFRWTYLLQLLITHLNNLKKKGAFTGSLEKGDVVLLLSSI
jgi:hypothetical protein